ncbi:hypothetical protein BD289DRAFT_363637 [Coniella lustricola]|uniref:Zn(2)-C6 fungal-type domain-containing protein n=1 Tax=Coniella lustricola TaxID=2025994 RepID=A0A2T3AF80_9PEZI|nr:hypothetical protein BD289DRAFT_363637 [Coniella lustricola]
MEFHPPQYTTPAVPRSVKFELVEDSHQYRARIPMRVQIYPHDTTESIISTVKNFYGLYPTPTSCPGVSFEDEHGNTIIGRYENFRHNSVVYVRVRDGPPTPGPQAALTNGSAVQTFYTQDGYPIHCAQPQSQHLSRPVSRSSRRRSVSPGSVNGRRSTSASTSGKHVRPRSSKNRGSGSQTNGESHSDSLNGYASSDGAPGSSSGKPKEQIGSTEISLDNIVEGGRRKRAKFESSELPLFAPPQMPAAISNPSVSPARRTEYNRASLPFVQPGHNPFSNPRVLQSPQTNGTGYNGANTYPTPAPASHPSRGTASYTTGTAAGPLMGILATPDPTVGSCMSEEDKDVAMQLMRLGDISNISHGRTSASTLDDTFSRNADAASSTGATSDGESESETDEKPLMQKHRLNAADAGRKLLAASERQLNSVQADIEQSDQDDGGYSDGAADGSMAAPKHKPSRAPTHHGNKSRTSSSKHKIYKATKSIKTATGAKVKKSGSIPNGPMSPTSLPASRKPSVTSNPPGIAAMSTEDDHPDLSTKPRCQRCRKSKKGCDRQRPCGRCRDAGIPAELCISEDEGNGRKGRYGRHMGVPIKTDHLADLSNGLLPPAPIATTAAILAGVNSADKNKKRKR